MNNILDEIMITKPGAPRITIYGKPGIGKSTLASQFPDPLFLLTEDPELPNISALPICTSFSDICDKIKRLLALDTLPFKTLVIDSISKLDTLVIQYILEKDVLKNGKKPTVIGEACNGFGKGYEKALDLHIYFKSLCDNFKKRGVAVIYVAHVGVCKFKAPDCEDYDTYSITMHHDKSRAPYINDVDAVLFCKLKSFEETTESKRTLIRSTNNKIIVSNVSDAHVSKNRYKMPEEIPMRFDAIAKYIPFYTSSQSSNEPLVKDNNIVDISGVQL